MRPAGRGETDSLYFDYPHFDAPEHTARNTVTHTPVAIVGAGPIGLTAALALARQGVRSVLFDNKATFNDGSRAICVARPSYYLLERIGAVGPFLDKALGWTTGRSFYRGQQILEFRMPDSPDEKYRPMYNLQQQYIEAYLWDAVAAHPLIDSRWQSTVTALDDTPNGVRVSVDDPHGSYPLEADWVLACDGARSPCRAMRGLRLQGENFEGRYVIADVQMAHDYPTIRRALFDPDCRRGGTVLIHKQPDNLWRIDYQLRDHESTEAAIAEETVRESVAAVLADIGFDGDWALEWWSVYTANTLALDDYRDGRVFFVGDSAHIVPIFGVRGLNNGLADAANIGWKLGWVLTGRAGPGLLESYTPERRGGHP
ncbi:MAG: FAD-dependent monooxygenase [Pseudomonadota bacterium]